MTPYLAILLGATLVSRASCHQVHGILLVNGTESPEWKYVRDVAPHFPYDPVEWEGSQFPKTPPIMDINGANITCGRNAFHSAAKTETADILAGSEVGFRVSTDGDGEYGYFWHPGPGMIYLSRAPNDDLENYRGDGDWFKIAYGGPVADNEWLIWKQNDFNFTIPETTPPGKYLMRIEQFMPTYDRNYTQWYVNCAHVNIIGPGGGTPTGFARFPGTYVVDQPGLLIPKNQFIANDEPPEGFKLLDYQPPGPAVWSG
ncbi:glycosyl hydrolase family 61-domain-containing protein [Chaetomium fimeti]|uniref:lytic cellulose monooxygenase (C4-dehydrogenating) n=1 Tax=Chaetomium fimeti TaxID=1854472 RepID=A0AAE0H5Q6_9PEZI|nr:glycosyl hydrolase family 61-domain-containing protein [Chaetomium fimeti]